MGQVVLAAVGYVVGGYFGYPQLGLILGATAGSLMTKTPGVSSTAPQISDLRVTGVEYGDPITWAKGHPAGVAGQVWWASNRRSIATTTSQGGKGGGPTVESTTYTYEVDLLVGFTSNPQAALLRLWLTGKLVFNLLPSAGSAAVAASGAISGVNWRRLTFYDGNAAQLPDPTYEAAVGVGNAPAYRGRCSIFIEGLQLGPGGVIPNITAEIASAGTPGAVGYNDNFNNGLGPYSAFSGSLNFFTAGTSDYGPTIDGVGRVSVGVVDRIRRTVPPGNATGVRVKFIVTDSGLDDSNECCLETAAGNVVTFAFLGSREGSFLRPALFMPVLGSTQLLGPSAIALNVWYQFILDIVPGVSNGSTWSITKISDGTLLSSGTLSGVIPAIAYDLQSFIQDSTAGAATASGSFADLQVIGTRASVTEETLQNVVSALCLRAGLQASQFDVSALSAITKPVRGLAISQVTPTRQVLDMLRATYLFDAVLSDKIYFRPQGAAVVATLTYDELGASTGPEGDPEPFAYKPASELELPGTWSITYMNADADGTKDTQNADRIGSAARTTQNTEVPLVFTASEAKAIADLWRDQAIIAARGTGTIKLLMTHANKEPGDAVNVTMRDGTTVRRIKLGKLDESNGIRAFDFMFEDANVLSQAGTTSTDYTGSSSVSGVAGTLLVLMDIAILRDADDDAGYYAAERGLTTPWPGGKVFSSSDNATYEDKATITEAAALGVCTTTLGNFTGGNVFDETSSVTVNIGTAGTLASDTLDNLLNLGNNAALVGNEILLFRTATLVSPGVYTLTSLLRGRRGTEGAIATHAASERFALLSTSGLRRIGVDTNEIGALRYVRGVSLGDVIASAGTQQITPVANGLKPFSPVDVRASRDVATNDITLTWSRRTRRAENFNSSVCPLGEATEEYAVEVYTSGTFLTLARTITAIATPTTVYTSAQQVTDFGSNQATVFVRVYQISAIVGRGTPAQATV